MFKYVLAAAVAVGVASPVFAQDSEPAAEKPVEFTGFKLEGLAGYDEEFVYGIGAGYDRQFGRIVLGAEAELSDSTEKDCLTSAFAPGDRFCSSLRRNIYAGGRIGFTLAPRTLLYGKIGYTNQRVATKYTAGAPASISSFDIAGNLDGIRLGGGLEQKLGRNAYVKGEYRYSDYENGDFRHDGVVGIGFRF
ncbi:MAG TPA: outer membrane beta-barrel protein [Allosphingosinicella sp.]|jgi:outer membrane immunogenic protein